MAKVTFAKSGLTVSNTVTNKFGETYSVNVDAANNYIESCWSKVLGDSTNGFESRPALRTVEEWASIVSDAEYMHCG